MKEVIKLKNKTAILVSLLMLSAFAVAVKPNGPSAANGLGHPGKASQLYLYEKDSEWNPVVGGAWGKLTVRKGGFVFNGHGLTPGEDYTLIRYTDPWPGSPVCLDAGTANDGGNIHLSGAMEDGGPKVWLVLTADVNCGTGMVGWNPAEYLFEYNTI